MIYNSGLVGELKVAIVHDWLVDIGGAEKVVAELFKMFPNSDVYTLIAQKSTIERLGLEGVSQSYIGRIPFASKFYRIALPFFPTAIESFDLSKYDLIISSSSSVAKGVIVSSKQLHICYCHSPARYMWDLSWQYMRDKENASVFRGLYSFVMRHFLKKLRIWDVVSANRVDYFLANSLYVKRRIEKVYRRMAEVINPPVNVDKFQLVSGVRQDYYFTASRLVSYKRIDTIIEAFSALPTKQLIVCGDGPERGRLEKIAGANVTFVGRLDDCDVVQFMQRAKAFIFAADEDFGIVPVEAQACGCPVICYGCGGVLETVIDGETGVYFESQTPQAIVDAVARFEGMHFDCKRIREHSEQFSQQTFRNRFSDFLAKVWSENR